MSTEQLKIKSEESLKVIARILLWLRTINALVVLTVIALVVWKGLWWELAIALAAVYSNNLLQNVKAYADRQKMLKNNITALEQQSKPKPDGK